MRCSDSIFAPKIDDTKWYTRFLDIAAANWWWKTMGTHTHYTWPKSIAAAVSGVQGGYLDPCTAIYEILRPAFHFSFLTITWILIGHFAESCARMRRYNSKRWVSMGSKGNAKLTDRATTVTNNWTGKQYWPKSISMRWCMHYICQLDWMAGPLTLPMIIMTRTYGFTFEWTMCGRTLLTAAADTFAWWANQLKICRNEKSF